MTSVPVTPKKATGVLDVGAGPPHVLESEEGNPSMWREAFPQRLVGMKKTVPEGTRAFLVVICVCYMPYTANDTSSHSSICKPRVPTFQVGTITTSSTGT